METRADQILREERRLRAFQAQADAISAAIVSSDLPRVDIEIQIERLRQEAERRFPRQMDLFARIYLARFRRLWAQWRAEGELAV